MQPSAINHIAQPAPAARPQPNMNNRLIVDFIVPETNDSDEDAVPGQRRIKAQQVKETLHAEHPDGEACLHGDQTRPTVVAHLSVGAPVVHELHDLLVALAGPDMSIEFGLVHAAIVKRRGSVVVVSAALTLI